MYLRETMFASFATSSRHVYNDVLSVWYRKKHIKMRGKFSAFLLVPEVAFILLYAFFVEYSPAAGPMVPNHAEESINTLYPSKHNQLLT